jgi:hypothetical protein
VVAIAALPDDPSIQVAAAIAVAAKEELIIVDADKHDVDDPYLRKLATDTGLTIKIVATAKVTLPHPATCAQAFRQTQERLVVMTRGAFADAAASTIAAARRVPVLVVEPPEIMAGIASQPKTAC